MSDNMRVYKQKDVGVGMRRRGGRTLCCGHVALGWVGKGTSDACTVGIRREGAW